jgi:ABC-type maltose transport system permease subunit
LAVPFSPSASCKFLDLPAAVMTAIPEITAYLCMQKNFEKGMSAGALK